MIFTAIAIAIATPGAADTASLADEKASLAVASLSQGREVEAIRVLERELVNAPTDPAVLINLGIAYAQQGDDAKARALFDAAMTSDDVIELETASGATVDSRKLARRAIAMLDRGEFRPLDQSSDQLTMRE